jgi:hypothetical protein
MTTRLSRGHHFHGQHVGGVCEKGNSEPTGSEFFRWPIYHPSLAAGYRPRGKDDNDKRGTNSAPRSLWRKYILLMEFMRPRFKVLAWPVA